MELNVTDINQLNLFPYVRDAAKIEVEAMESSSGSIRAGAYTFLARYLDEFSTPTNFFAQSSQIAVPINVGGNTTPVGGAGGEPTSRLLRLVLRSVDTFYDRIQIAVIPQYDGVPGTPILLTPFTITGPEMHIVYSGDERGTETSLEELLINNASYKTAKSMAQVDDSLYLGNLTKHEPINYQKYANNIVVKTVTNRFSPIENEDGSARFTQTAGSLARPENLAHKSRGYKRGEVYAFYISFILNDGTESPAYHIPGRPPAEFSYAGTRNENDIIPVEPSTVKFIGIGGSQAQWFQFISHPKSGVGTGYWQNRNEKYPITQDWEIWDVDENGEGVFTGQTLAGQHVRHHHMPDADKVPFYDPNTGEPIVLGVRFENVKIPDDLKDRIKAVRFHYAKRDLQNQRVMDQSFILTTNITDFQTDWYVAFSRVTHASQQFESADTNPLVLVHPFNTLRTKQSVQGIDYLKRVAINSNPGTQFSGSFTAMNVRMSENLIQNMEFGTNIVQDFWPVMAAGYIPSYSFPSGGGVNSLVRTSENLETPYDFDNTNGEEKIALSLNYLLGSDPFQSQFPLANILADICQYRTDMYINFDRRELVFTGHQESDLTKFVERQGEPSPGFFTDEVYGGDTYIGITAMRHSRWLVSDPGSDVDYPHDPLLQNVRFSMVECYVWPDYRSPGDEPWEQYYPGTTNLRSYRAILWKDGQPVNANDDIDGSLFPDNVIRYNRDYIGDQTYKPAFPFLTRRSEAVDLSTRIARSRQADDTTDVDLFRQFREEDFIDLPRNRGEIVRLSTFNNILIPHLERAIYRTRAKEEIQTGDFRAFLGTGDLFSVEPQELYETDTGYAGLQGLFAAVVTEFGYFFVDQLSRKVFHLTAEGLQDVGLFGIDQFLKNRLEFNFEKYGLTKIDGSLQQFRLEVGWDPVQKRYLITKHDMKSVEGIDLSEFEFNEEAQQFIYPEAADPTGPIPWSDEDYFEVDSVTLSYYPELRVWGSFHSYIPQAYLNSSSDMYTVHQSLLFQHHRGDRGRFYSVLHRSFMEFVDNRQAEVSKLISGLFINSEVRSGQGVSLPDKTVTAIRVRNTEQDTGEVPVSFFTSGGNARRAQGFWRINQLRNAIAPSGELGDNIDWYDKEWLSDRYHYVKLIFDNESNRSLYILSSELNVKQALR